MAGGKLRVLSSAHVLPALHQDRAALAPEEGLQKLVDLPTPAVIHRYVNWQLRCLGSVGGGGDAASATDSASVRSGSIAAGSAAADAESVHSSHSESGGSSSDSDGSGSSSDSSDEEEWLEVSVGMRLTGVVWWQLSRNPALLYSSSSDCRPPVRTHVLVPARNWGFQLDAARGPCEQLQLRVGQRRQRQR